MAISEADIKMLWGRAAGMCSNPRCEQDLTIMLDGGTGFNIGEMAHVIAQKSGGPRGVPEGGRDVYENLILLCPTCHRMIDKAPDGEYSVEMLIEWKGLHEAAIRDRGKKRLFASKKDLWNEVGTLLRENYILWHELGPQSKAAEQNPGSNLFKLWNFRKLDSIIPNNTKIINYIETNKEFVNGDEIESFLRFKMHALAFENNQYGRLEEYPTFPEEFGRIFNK